MRPTSAASARANAAGGAAGKVAVFGLLKRGGKAYTAIIPDARSRTILPIIQEHVRPDSIVYTDTFRSDNALDVSDFRHRRINQLQIVHAGEEPHQWDQKEELLLVPERMRVAIQRRGRPGPVKSAQNVVQVGETMILSYDSPTNKFGACSAKLVGIPHPPPAHAKLLLYDRNRAYLV